MKFTLHSDEQIHASLLRYLTETMPEDERALFEERLIVDHEFSDAVAGSEQEIIDSCAAEKFPREEFTIVREWIDASPRRSQRFKMAQSLLRSEQRKARSHRRAMIMTIAACLLVAVGLSIGRFEQTSRKPYSTSSVAALPAGQPTSLSGRIPSPPSKSVATATLLLVAERTRGDLPMASYKIPQDVPVHVEVLLSDASAGGSYELKIYSSDRARRIALKRQNLSARRSSDQTFIDATFAAGSLPPAIYQARVRSGERVMISRFVVTP